MGLKTTLQALIGTSLLRGLTVTTPVQIPINGTGATRIFTDYLSNVSPANSGSSIGRLQIDAVWKF